MHLQRASLVILAIFRGLKTCLSMKLEFVREKLAEQGADAFIIINHEGSGQPDTAYLSGFSGSESFVLVTMQKQFIIVDGRYYTRVGQEAPDFEMVKGTRSRFYADLNELAGKLGLKSVMLDPQITSYSSILGIKKDCPGLEVKTYASLLHEIRVSKTPEELELLKDSANIACAAFNQLLGELKAGQTEKWVAARLEYLMKEKGGDRYSFDTIVASGTNGAFPHYVPGDKALQNGELVTIDFGCYYKGYASDMTRTVAIGEVSDKLKDIYNTVKKSQQAGCGAAQAGVSGQALDKVCRDVISGSPYKDYFLHGTGHGLGLDVHEYPYVNTLNEGLLPLNSVVTIEPGIYIEGVGGVRIEDCLILKEGGAENINTAVTKELVVIG